MLLAARPFPSLLRTHVFTSRRPSACVLPSFFFALLHHQIKEHLPSFQLLPHSFAKTPGWRQERFSAFNFQLSTVDLLSALSHSGAKERSTSPSFSTTSPALCKNTGMSARAFPKFLLATNSVERNTYGLRACKPFIRNTYKKQGRGRTNGRPSPLLPKLG